MQRLEELQQLEEFGDVGLHHDWHLELRGRLPQEPGAAHCHQRHQRIHALLKLQAAPRLGASLNGHTEILWLGILYFGALPNDVRRDKPKPRKN